MFISRQRHKLDKQMSESKVKAFTQSVDKVLKSFDNSNEWADLISNLARLKKLIEYQAPRFGGHVPCLVQIAKRLCQCLHPNLPSGVHLKAIDVYFALIAAQQCTHERNPLNISKLLVYTPAICQLYPHSSYTVRPQMLRLIEVLYLPAAVQEASSTVLPCLLASLFAAVDEPAASEHADGTAQFLDKLLKSAGYEDNGVPRIVSLCDVFFDGLWSAIAMDQRCRLAALEFVLTKLERRDVTDCDALGIGSERLTQNAPSICACLSDESNLVRRASLDVIVGYIPTSTQTHGDTLEEIMAHVLPIVLLHDASLNRRILTWILRQSSCTTDKYFLNHSRPLLIRTIIKALQSDSPLNPRIVGIVNYLLEQPQLTPTLLDSPILIKIMLLCTANSACSEVRRCFQALIYSLRPNYLWSVVTDNFVLLCSGESTLPDMSFDKLSSLCHNLLELIGTQSYCGLHRLQNRLLDAVVKRIEFTSCKDCTNCLRVCLSVQQQIEINETRSCDAEVITEVVVFTILDKIEEDEEMVKSQPTLEYLLLNKFAKYKIFCRSQETHLVDMFNVICEILLSGSKNINKDQDTCTQLMSICEAEEASFSLRCCALKMIITIATREQFDSMYETGFVANICNWLYFFLNDHLSVAEQVQSCCKLLLQCERIWTNEKPVEKLFCRYLSVDESVYVKDKDILDQEQALNRLHILWNYGSRQADDSLRLIKNIVLLVIDQLPRLSNDIHRNDSLIESLVIKWMLDSNFDRILILIIELLDESPHRHIRQVQHTYKLLSNLLILCPRIFVKRVVMCDHALVHELFRHLTGSLDDPAAPSGLRNECLLFLTNFFTYLEHKDWIGNVDLFAPAIRIMNELFCDDPLDITRCQASLSTLPWVNELDAGVLTGIRAQVVASVVCTIPHQSHQRSVGLIVCCLKRLLAIENYPYFTEIFSLVVQQLCDCLLDTGASSQTPQSVLATLRFIWNLIYLRNDNQDNLYFGRVSKVCVASNFEPFHQPPDANVRQLVQTLLPNILAALVSITNTNELNLVVEISEVAHQFVDNLMRDYVSTATSAIIILWGERRHRFRLTNATSGLVRFLEHYLPPEFLYTTCTDIVANIDNYLGDRKREDFRIWTTQVVLSYFEKFDVSWIKDGGEIMSTSSVTSLNDLICSFLQKASEAFQSPPECFLLLRFVDGLVSRNRLPTTSESDSDVFAPKCMKNVQSVIVSLVQACNIVVASSLEHSSWLKRSSGYVVKPAVVQTQSPVMDLSRTLSNCTNDGIASIRGIENAAETEDSRVFSFISNSDDTMNGSGLNSDSESSNTATSQAFQESQHLRPEKEIKLYSLQAIVVLADHLPNLLDCAFRTDEKERTVVPLLSALLTNLLPFLRTRRQSNSPSVRATSKLLQRLSQYSYARRVLKKDVFDHYFDPAFFHLDRDALQSWMSMIHNFMSNDRSTFKEVLGRVNTVQTGLFITSEQESDQKARLMRRLSLIVLAAPFDFYQSSIPELHDYISEIIRTSPSCALHAQVFTFVRVLTLRFSSRYLVSLYPIIHSELLQILINLEQALGTSQSRHHSVDLSPLHSSSPQANSRSVSSSSPSSLHSLIQVDSLSDLNSASLNMLCSAFKLIEMLLSLPVDDLPQFQSYRCAFSTMVIPNSTVSLKQPNDQPHLIQLKSIIENNFGPNLPTPLVLDQHPILTARQITSLRDLYGVVSSLCHYCPQKTCKNNTNGSSSSRTTEEIKRQVGIWKRFEYVLIDEFTDDWIKKVP